MIAKNQVRNNGGQGGILPPGKMCWT